MSTALAQPIPVNNESEVMDEDSGYTAWLRVKIQRAVDDPRPRIPHAEAMARIRRSIEEVAREQAQGRI